VRRGAFKVSTGSTDDVDACAYDEDKQRLNVQVTRVEWFPMTSPTSQNALTCGNVTTRDHLALVKPPLIW
jgi:hypothetical protein